MTTAYSSSTRLNNTTVPTSSINDAQSMDRNHDVLPSGCIKKLLIIIALVAVVIVLLSMIVFLLPIWNDTTKCSSNCNSNFSKSFRRSTTSSQIQDIVADFIIIGGGTAGCIVSAKLAEYGFETLLLSSGTNDTLNPLMRETISFDQLFGTSYLKHYLPLSPSPNLNNRTLDVVAWNTLGGNSINGGGIERMMANDWNYFINATDDLSFHFKNMAKYYKIVEDFSSTSPFSSTNVRGTGGPIKITHVYDPVFNDVWKRVANELNETFTNDLADEIDYGFSFESSSFTNGLRSWSCDAYLTSTMNKHRNLKVLTGATAIKFNLNKKTKQIQNVLFVSENGLFNGIARKEFILSAGTFYSPHILMLSGIGDPEILQRNKIPIKHELKQVGKNLMDNGLIIVRYQTQNFSIGQSIPVALINTQYRTNDVNPDIFYLLRMNDYTKHLIVIIFNASPKSSVGSISLHNSNPLVPPKISLDYLTDEKDLETFINGINYVRKIMSAETIKRYAKITEISPGIEKTDLRAFVRNTVTSSNHFIGTCSMGKNAESSVVDRHFKIHGISNLRVVDGSVFPANFTSKTGPYLTIHALAVKAADILCQTYS